MPSKMDYGYLGFPLIIAKSMGLKCDLLISFIHDSNFEGYHHFPHVL